MLALKVVFSNFIILLIISFLVYIKSSKEMGKLMFQSTLGAIVVYVLLVLSIGLAPKWMG